jgi:hypothetical protein
MMLPSIVRALHHRHPPAAAGQWARRGGPAALTLGYFLIWVTTGVGLLLLRGFELLAVDPETRCRRCR